MTDDNVPKIDYWKDIRLEVYCGLNLDYFGKCNEFNYQFNTDDDPETWFSDKNKVPNTDYDPDIVPNKFPDKCKREITVDCLSCEFCMYCEYGLEEEE